LSKVVLIVGAGASQELDVLTGNGLVREIVQNIDYNPNYIEGGNEGQFKDLINQFLNLLGKKSDTEIERSENRLFVNTYLIPFKEDLRRWSEDNKSLDSYLNQNSIEDVCKYFGKFCIAYYIIGCEEWLMRENLYSFSENWFRYFFEIHLAPIKKELSEGKVPVQIITFNYDRIIENFLYNFLRHTPNPVVEGWNGGDLDPSKMFVEKFEIIHVYGKLADLEWENRKEPNIRFAERNNIGSHLALASGSIKIIAETGPGRISEEVKKKIRKVVQEAGKIYFLGFGFDQENMKILFGDGVNEDRYKPLTTCIATAFNLDPSVKSKYPFIFYYTRSCANLVRDTNLFQIKPVEISP
jgi:hypothetical protein